MAGRAGWHPAAWREPPARPGGLFTASYWRDLVVEAERGLLDFATVEDSPAPPGFRTDRVRERLDAVLTAARVAPRTERLGFLPTAVATHTEPFHLSKAIATLDFVSTGRAGVQVEVSVRGEEFAHFGRRELPESAKPLFDEGADWIEVLRRLWDSWEDDAEIRDVATGRFIDREKLHHVDFAGEWFNDCLDELDGAEHTSEALQFTGTAGELVDLLVSWADSGIDGFRLGPPRSRTT